MSHALFVFIGGGLGALLRWWFGIAAARFEGGALPLGTFGVNIIGSFAMGLLAGHLLQAGAGGSVQNESLRLFLGVGILGGFTTFSAFSLDAAHMIEAGQWHQAGLYVFASVLLSVVAMFAGMALSRLNG